MTTAHRPTWHAVLGGANQGGNVLVATTVRTVRDLPNNLKLKPRHQELVDFQAGQNEDVAQGHLPISRDGRYVAQGPEELLAQVEKDLDALEKSAGGKKGQESGEVPLAVKRGAILKEELPDDKVKRVNQGSVLEVVVRENSESSEEDEDELLAELSAIKKERDAKANLKAEKMSTEERERLKNVAGNNPLMVEEDSKMRRSWFDDSVFKNQARLDKEPPLRFINDRVRSDFHRNFLRRYIQ